jgi:hypothetical protein
MQVLLKHDMMHTEPPFDAHIVWAFKRNSSADNTHALECLSAHSVSHYVSFARGDSRHSGLRSQSLNHVFEYFPSLQSTAALKRLQIQRILLEQLRHDVRGPASTGRLLHVQGWCGWLQLCCAIPSAEQQSQLRARVFAGFWRWRQLSS